MLGRQPIYPEDRIVAHLVDLCAKAGRQRLAVLVPEHGDGFVALDDGAEEGDALADREGLMRIAGLLQFGRNCKGGKGRIQLLKQNISTKIAGLLLPI